MNPFKERLVTTKAITTLLTSVLVASFAGTMISMPQMIQSVNAQSEQGSENACKELPGATLERGQCIAPAESELVCDPSSVGGVTATRTGDTCTATTTLPANKVNDFRKACEDIVVDGTHGTFTQANVPKSGDKIVTCKFPATETFDCPGDIIPTSEGLCITKPGNRSEEA
jgi:hypothetical protein